MTNRIPSFILPIPLLTGLLLCLILPNEGMAQSYKSYYRPGSSDPATFLRANEIIPVPGSTDFALVGSVKGPAPGYASAAFMLRFNANGEMIDNLSLATAFSNSTNGVRGSSLAFDQEGNTYIGGSSVPNLFGPTVGSERTITCLSVEGDQVWSRMQANYNFESIVYDPRDQALITVSGPNSTANPNSNIMLNKVDQEGKLIKDLNIVTTTEDHAVKVILVPDGGYLVAATFDLQGVPCPMLVRMDQNFDLMWANSYGNKGHRFSVADLAWHPEGFAALTGTVEYLGGQREPFLLAIDSDGQARYLQTIRLNSMSRAEGHALTAFNNGVQSGFIIVGEYALPGSGESRSLAMALQDDGELMWIQSYSHYPPEDYTYEEQLSSVCLLEGEMDFAAAGVVSRSLYGNQLDTRQVIVVRASLRNGLLPDDGNCSVPVAGKVVSSSISGQAVGTGLAGGGLLGFGYNVSELNWERRYCSFKAAKQAAEPTTPLAFSELEVAIRHQGSGTLEFHYQSPEPEGKVNYALYNLQGQLIGQGEGPAGSHDIKIKLGSYTSGLYLLHINNTVGRLISRKLWLQP